MMNFNCRFGWVVGLVIVWIAVSATAADLRDQYGTRSLEAAGHIEAAINLAKAKKLPDADKEIDQAIQADPSCAMSRYWKGIITERLGDIDQCIEHYKKCIALRNDENRKIIASAENNLGVTLGRLQRYDESGYWLSRAIVEDEDNVSKQQAKAYHDLAVTLHLQGHNLSAGLTAKIGHDIDAVEISEKMVDDFLSGVGAEEVARVLTLENDAPTTQADAPKPHTAVDLKSVTLAGQSIDQPIAGLFADVQGRWAIAIPRDGTQYYLITFSRRGQEPSADVKAIAVSGPITAACLVEGDLFIAAAPASGSAKFSKLEIESGKVLESFDLDRRAEALAVFPSRNAAFYSSQNVIYRLDLQSGKTSSTEYAGQALTTDPSERFLYSRLKEPLVDHSQHLVVNGRPVTIRTHRNDMTQTVLVKYYVGVRKLIPAEMRINAASNGYDVVVSPDGKWVSLPGGGGWRPSVPNPGSATGYVIPVFSTFDFNKVLACFSVDAYPMGCAFNPVTTQVLAVREKDVKVFDMANPSAAASQVIAGEFSNACAWSGNGCFALVANKKSGVAIYSNTLSNDELAHSANWYKSVAVAPRFGVPVAHDASSPRQAVAVPELTQFEPSSDAQVVQKVLDNAISSGSTDRPLAWGHYEPYAAAAKTNSALSAIDAKGEPGIRIYQLKKILQDDPSSVVAQYTLACALRDSGQAEAARKSYLAVVRADAGRTELTVASLKSLATQYAVDSQEISAVHCLAEALSLDRASHATVEQLNPLLAKLKWTQEAQKVAALRTSDDPGLLGSAAPHTAQMPVLDNPPPDPKTMNGDQIYQTCAASVVLIRCGEGAGTGVCVGKSGIVLTSLHVISSGNGTIAVYPFAMENGKAHKLTKCTASVLVKDVAADLAVLSVDDAPASLKPLSVALSSPAPGKTVFAIGNPGLGDQTLDLTLSQGIISNSNRLVEGHSYLQHTASVNPGNSGGPLLNDAGQVVGVVCLKAHLEGVSFATPIEKVRALFPAQAPPK